MNFLTISSFPRRYILNQLQNYNWSSSKIENIKNYIKIKNKPSKIRGFIEQLIQRSHNSLEKEDFEVNASLPFLQLRECCRGSTLISMQVILVLHEVANY